MTHSDPHPHDIQYLSETLWRIVAETWANNIYMDSQHRIVYEASWRCALLLLFNQHIRAFLAAHDDNTQSLN